MVSFWESKIVLVASKEEQIKQIEKILAASRVNHFLRVIKDLNELQFELQFNPPHAIITGRKMNGFSAFEVLDTVKKVKVSVPTILIDQALHPKEDIELALHGIYEILPLSEPKALLREFEFLMEQIKAEKLTA